MSYWNEIEQTPGNYEFKELDQQLKQISNAKGQVTLCLGARQPRWPESHWPDWAWELPKTERDKALLIFVKTVTERYKDNPRIVSFQLENEALLKSFGQRSEVDRKRLRTEFALVKKLAPNKPIIMTTSTSWGIPLRRPIPDMIGFSFYQTVYNNGYHTSFHKPWLDRARATLIRLLWHKSSFIHELQLEPWGPKNIWEMDVSEQDKSMSPDQIKTNLRLARKTGLAIDLWGAEWWYWRHKNGDSSIWKTVKTELQQNIR